MGEVAALQSKSDRQPIRLKKVSNQWMLDFESVFASSEAQKAMPAMAALADVARQTATDIAAGKYATVQEARGAYGRQALSALTALGTPTRTTQPASRATTRAGTRPAKKPATTRAVIEQ